MPKTLTFTDDEHAALCGMFPRHLVVGSVNGPDTPLARALYKLNPHLLPYAVQRDVVIEDAP